MSHVIRVVGRPGGVEPAQPGPEWVKSYDPDAFDGRGDVETTFDPAEALRFMDARSAFRFLRQRSTVRPTREDGRPNRPLTSLTVEIERAPKPGGGEGWRW